MTNAEMLAQAKSALHRLITGTKAVSVRYADRYVQYTETNINDLRAYIADLEELDSEVQTTRGHPFEVHW